MLPYVLILLVICAIAYFGLRFWNSRQRRQLGLEAGCVEAADDSRLGSATLRSERLGLVARPDHVLDVDGMRIPVEQKPYARRAWPSHTLQVCAQCVLLEETSGVRPSHGVLMLSHGQQERVPFTPELENHLAATMQLMRRILETRDAPGPYWSPGKCAWCGYREICWGADRPAVSTPAAGQS